MRNKCGFANSQNTNLAAENQTSNDSDSKPDMLGSRQLVDHASEQMDLKEAEDNEGYHAIVSR